MALDHTSYLVLNNVNEGKYETKSYDIEYKIIEMHTVSNFVIAK